MNRTRVFLSVLALLLGFAALPPVQAQEMRTPGIDFSWFRSSQEQAQRDACRRNLPECRATVRAKMNFEQSITVIVPWAGLGIAILGVLLWLRGKEKKRERQKRLARMNHTPGAQRKLDKAKEEKADEEETDRLAF